MTRMTDHLQLSHASTISWSGPSLVPGHRCPGRGPNPYNRFGQSGLSPRNPHDLYSFPSDGRLGELSWCGRYDVVGSVHSPLLAEAASDLAVPVRLNSDHDAWICAALRQGR